MQKKNISKLYLASVVANGVLLVLAVLLGARILADATVLRDERAYSEALLDEQLSHDDEGVEILAMLPVVAFRPAANFTNEERMTLWDRVITPHTDYSECLGEQPVSVLIEKRETPIGIADTTYLYNVTVMLRNPDGTKNAVVESFLHGEVDSELVYWVPDLIFTQCVDVLPNADDVRDRAVDRYNG